jgi:hypothetical protein
VHSAKSGVLPRYTLPDWLRVQEDIAKRLRKAWSWPPSGTGAPQDQVKLFDANHLRLSALEGAEAWLSLLRAYSEGLERLAERRVADGQPGAEG